MGRRNFGSKTRQEVSWTFMPSTHNNLTGNAVVVGANLVVSERVTVRRVRGSIHAGLEGTIAANDQCLITVGLIVAGSDAIALGASAMQDPAGAAESPWLWWYQFVLRSPGAFTDATWVSGSFGPAAQVVEVDSKAMRQLKPGEGITWVMQYTNLSGNPPVQLDVGIQRVLIGLH